jgi:SAM-dependent methyltransferase
MLKRLAFWNARSEPVVEHQGVRFPAPVLWVLLAQGASAEVRRRYEGQGNVFDRILEDRDFQTAFLESYWKANHDYFTAIRPHLPSHGGRILDIGAGIGLLDLLIYRQAATAKPTLFLLDQSVDVQQLPHASIAPTGFNEKYVFTASMAVTSNFLQLNGVAEADLRLCEADSWRIPQGAPFDLIFSRKSWGFHYPLSEYLHDAVRCLSAQGCVITDIRANQGAEELIEREFGEMKVLQQGSKSALMLARQRRIPA